MNGRLENKCRGFDEKDIKKLSRAFDRLDKNASITPDEQDRILSSVMRKAGIEMEERTKDNIKVTGRGFSAIAAAAAVRGDAKMVRAPGPWRPSKLRLDVDTANLPAGTLSSFIAKQAAALML